MSNYTMEIEKQNDELRQKLAHTEEYAKTEIEKWFTSTASIKELI